MVGFGNNCAVNFSALYPEENSKFCDSFFHSVKPLFLLFGVQYHNIYFHLYKEMNFRTGGCEKVRENKAFSTSLSLSYPRAHWREAL
jgi:hypothetical protein